jgi:hypothetical protein
MDTAQERTNGRCTGASAHCPSNATVSLEKLTIAELVNSPMFMKPAHYSVRKTDNASAESYLYLHTLLPYDPS